MSSLYDQDDTIAAIATPPGEGGVAIIRICGPQAVQVANKIFTGDVASYASHTTHYGRVQDGNRNTIDHALLLVMGKGRSYTGDETVEVHCHGGSLIARRVLEVALAAGARLAYPGEFTYRAYRNGNLDLAQAEAVQALIGAKNELAVDAAGDQLQGRLSERVRQFQRQLIEVAALLEAWVDFPEEGLEFTTVESLSDELTGLVGEMRRLIDTFQDGRVIHEGLSLCLVGCPNVGKSSLMNALVERERAIVTATPGTTRDLVEDSLRLGGLHFKVIDTAGIRDAADEVEQEGIRRSHQAMERADVVLLVLDGSRPLAESDQQLLGQVKSEKAVAVWNKRDLMVEAPPQLALPHVVTVSAKQRQGLRELHTAIERLIWKQGPPARDEVVLTQQRHKEALLEAVQACQAVRQGLAQQQSPEFLCVDVRQALAALGRIIGLDVTEEVLTSIFSRFCLGK